MHVAWSLLHPMPQSTVRSYVPREGGIYLLCCRLTAGGWQPCYVGEAADLCERLLDHLSSLEANAALKEHLRGHLSGCFYARVEGPAERTRLMKFLYDAYRPECNEADPGGAPLPVNLPPLAFDGET